MNVELKEAVDNFMFFLGKMSHYSNSPIKEWTISDDDRLFISGAPDALLNGYCTYCPEERFLLKKSSYLSNKIANYYLWWPHLDLSQAGLDQLNQCHLQETVRLFCLSGELSKLKSYPIPAAIISLVKQNQVVGVYTGTTLSPFKNKGILNALYANMIRRMQEIGVERMVYQSKQDILINKIKDRFGFHKIGQLIGYKIGS